MTDRCIRLWRYLCGSAVFVIITLLSIRISQLSCSTTLLSSSSRTSPAALRLSEQEGFGFFHEPDDVWQRRKERHILQMNREYDLHTRCPSDPGELPFFEPALSSPDRVCITACQECCEVKCPARMFWAFHYEPSFSCNFERRLGVQGDGGKWICDPQEISKRAIEKDACLVYSIGSHGEYHFEKAVHTEISPNCEIHTVDASPWQEYTRLPPPEYVQYTVAVIGPAPSVSISDLVKRLGHTGRTIELFKIDCEGCELETVRYWLDRGVFIRQILVEIHAPDGNKKPLHDFFEFLFAAGYVVFHKEPNLIPGGTCFEYGFIKLRREFSNGTSA